MLDGDSEAIDFWAMILSTEDVEDVQTACIQFCMSGDAFPTVGKIHSLAVKARRERKGHPTR